MEIILKVKVYFYNADEGGRNNPVSSGYRSSILFGITKDNAFVIGKRSDYKELGSSILNSSGCFSDFLENVPALRSLN